MSRLNANAFSFVPGQAFKLPQPAQPSAPAPPPVERPPQTEAPAPAPTITLNIGGSKPTPPPVTPPPTKAPSQHALATPSSGRSTPTPQPAAAPSPLAAKPAPPSSAPAPTPSTTFTLERAKMDTLAIAQEVQAAADESTLKDLFGNGGSMPMNPLVIEL